MTCVCVTQAYNVLSKEDSRQHYDRTGSSSRGGSPFNAEDAAKQFAEFEKMFDAFLAGEYDKELEVLMGTPSLP